MLHAQERVSIYGIADAGYGFSAYRYRDGAVRIDERSSALRDGYLNDSRWGMRGEEALSGGQKISFNLEQGVHLTTGAAASTSRAFDRIATLGLSGKQWGTLTFGRQRSVSEQFFKADIVKSLGKMARAFGAYKVRRDGLIRYISSEWGGIRLGLGYAPNGTIAGRANPAADQHDHYVTAALGYTFGALQLAALYDQEQPLDAATGMRRGYAVKNWVLAASWDFSAIRLNVAWGRDANGKMNKPGDVDKTTLGGFVVPGLGAYAARGFNSRNLFVSVLVPAGRGRIGLSWSRSSSNLARIYAANNAGATLATGAQNIWGVIYTHALSKRTTIYAYAAHGRSLAYLKSLRGSEAGLGVSHKY